MSRGIPVIRRRKLDLFIQLPEFYNTPKLPGWLGYSGLGLAVHDQHGRIDIASSTLSSVEGHNTILFRTQKDCGASSLWSLLPIGVMVSNPTSFLGPTGPSRLCRTHHTRCQHQRAKRPPQHRAWQADAWRFKSGYHDSLTGCVCEARATPDDVPILCRNTNVKRTGDRDAVAVLSGSGALNSGWADAAPRISTTGPGRLWQAGDAFHMKPRRQEQARLSRRLHYREDACAMPFPLSGQIPQRHANLHPRWRKHPWRSPQSGRRIQTAYASLSMGSLVIGPATSAGYRW